MTVLQLHAKIEELMQRGWLDEEVLVCSNNGNSMQRVEIVNVIENTPPVPKWQEIHILVDD